MVGNEVNLRSAVEKFQRPGEPPSPFDEVGWPGCHNYLEGRGEAPRIPEVQQVLSHYNRGRSVFAY